MQTTLFPAKSFCKPNKIVFQSHVGEVTSTYKPTRDLSSLVKVTTSRDFHKFIRAKWNPDLLNYVEQMAVIFVNRRHRIIGWAIVSTGGSSGTVCDPKIVFQKALLLHAEGFCLVHNHPSGECTPSQADISLTKKMRDGAKLLEMNLLDHIIIGGSDSYYSMADKGLI
jgi:DNA repair protein RadC